MLKLLRLITRHFMYREPNLLGKENQTVTANYIRVLLSFIILETGHLTMTHEERERFITRAGGHFIKDAEAKNILDKYQDLWKNLTPISQQEAALIEKLIASPNKKNLTSLSASFLAIFDRRSDIFREDATLFHPPTMI